MVLCEMFIIRFIATKNTTCETIDEECVCYWHGEETLSYNEAMEYCMSDGGTLAYPSSEDKLIALLDLIGNNNNNP